MSQKDFNAMKMTSTNLSCLSDINLKSFRNFCKNNIPLLVITAIILFFCYGIKLFQYSIGIDTEFFMADKADMIKWALQIGRFGHAFFEWLLHTKGFNPFTTFLSTFCLIYLFTISWCYIIAVFSKNTDRNNAFIPFAIVFISSPIWAEQFYFVTQSTEVALMVLICPYAIYLLFKGFLAHETGKIIFAFFLLILMISVYQAMVPFFCCGIFICFLLLLKTSDYEPLIYRNLCFKLLATLVGAMIVYSIIDRILIPSVFGIEKSQYFDSMNLWGKIPVKENINRILLMLAGILSIGNIFGNILILPIAVFFMVKVIKCKRQFIYIFIGICVPLSIMFLAILGGNVVPLRAMYVLPLAVAFMFFFLIETCSKKVASVVVILALLTAVYQAQITAQLFYSDQMRYNEDVRLAYEICDMIIKTYPDNNLPVAIIGQYRIAEKFQANFLQGEVIGHSFFEHQAMAGEVIGRSLSFMRTLGINFNAPNNEQIQQALNEARFMPPYPHPLCVKKLPNVIVVRL